MVRSLPAPSARPAKKPGDSRRQLRFAPLQGRPLRRSRDAACDRLAVTGLPPAFPGNSCGSYFKPSGKSGCWRAIISSEAVSFAESNRQDRRSSGRSASAASAPPRGKRPPDPGCSGARRGRGAVRWCAHRSGAGAPEPRDASHRPSQIGPGLRPIILNAGETPALPGGASRHPRGTRQATVTSRVRARSLQTDPWASPIPGRAGRCYDERPGR